MENNDNSVPLLPTSTGAPTSGTLILSRDAKFYLGVVASMLSLDLMFNLLLLTTVKDETDDGNGNKFDPRTSINFHKGILDLISFSVVRIVVQVLAILIAMRIASVTSGSNYQDNWTHQAVTKDPILISTKSAEGKKDAKVHAFTNAVLEREHESFQSNQRAVYNKNVILCIVFVINTALGVTAAVKTVGFHFDSEAKQGVLMCIDLLIANTIFFFMKKALNEFTKEPGYFFPNLHNHKLYFEPKLLSHRCDICTGKIVAEAYRCKQCDFDVCAVCFQRNVSREQKQQKPSAPSANGDVSIEDAISSRSYFFRALAYAFPNWPLLLTATICLLTSSAAALLLPGYTGKILDSVYHRDEDEFWKNVEFMTYASILTGALSSLRSACISILGRRIAARVRMDLFSAIIVQDIAFMDSQMTGALTSRLTNDVSGMVGPWNTLINSLLSSLLSLIGGLILCFVTSWKLSVIALTCICPIVYITGVYANWSQKINRKIWAALADANAVATEAISSFRVVKSFSTEVEEIEKFSGAVNYALRNGIRDTMMSSATYAFTEYIDLGTSVLILGYGGSTVINHPDELSPGDLVAFQMYWSVINGAISSLSGTVNSLTRSAGAAHRVLTLLDSLPKVDPTAGRIVTKNEIRGELRLDDVTFTYKSRPESPVLKNVNLLVEAGKVCALVGRSGGGKSTIVHLLLRFYDPDSGRVLLDGMDIKELQNRSIHRLMGVVAQDTILFSQSILSNIIYGLDPDEITVEDVIFAAKEAHAYDFIMSLEEGFQTKVGEKGVKLSGGQRQRIAIARAFLRKPKVLLLDESTSALDAEAEGIVQEAIDRLIAKSESTVLLIAHRLSTVINSDKIAVVDAGKIVEEGTHSELLNKTDDEGIYKKLVMKQLKSKEDLSNASASLSDAKE